MFAICVESSHKRGMGHFFRAMNLIDHLIKKNMDYIILINNDLRSISWLEEKHIRYKIIDLEDFESAWERDIITQNGIKYWINDRLDTNIRHSKNVKSQGTKLITFDDRGDGAELADINFAALSFDNKSDLKGKKVFSGVEYLILNKEIEEYKRTRKSGKDLLVTLGGSDTYGVTLKVAKILKNRKKKATILIGPSFGNEKELNDIAKNSDLIIKHPVPSLIEEFFNYDLAITGGGITPFEANASGLPCIIIANELFEIENAKFLARTGSSVFAGFHKNLQTEVFEQLLDIEKMSIKGMNSIKTDGIERVYAKICEVCEVCK